MSAHPYRQKAGGSAPYPVDDPESAPGSATVPSASSYSFHTPLDSLTQLNNQDISDQEIHLPDPSHSGNIKNLDIDTTYDPNASRPNAPYPVYDSGSTPSPVFASSKEPKILASPQILPLRERITSPSLTDARDPRIVSPGSHPLSATSSLTNFNLNGQAIHEGYSRSESDLLGSVHPPGLTNYSHGRSVSSTSSFFYDRADNSSMVDFSQNVIQLYLGSNLSHLLPRIKTIELYRKNAKKSNDPQVLFQYAQYMLQTALVLDNAQLSLVSSPNISDAATPIVSPSKPDRLASSLTVGKKHTKSKSASSSFEFDVADGGEIDDVKLKQALLKEAVHYLRKLSDKGYVDAQYLLGDAYSSGALGKVDNREAFHLFQTAAKHGHTESAYRTSYCYEEGLGTGRDARKALEYLKMAASKNHPSSMYKLGVYSFYGRMGLPDNINSKKAGIKWLTRASNVANELIAAAPYELGKIHYDGFKDIVISDRKYALELYSQAAALGHVQSAAILGKAYEMGDVVPQDANLSIHYYTQAAMGGDPESMLAMCAWYLVGSDPYLPKDEAEAFEWAKRAAMCDLPRAQFALANFYEKGIGCIKSQLDAQEWYKKGAENGDEKCLARLNDKDAAAKLAKRLKKKKSSNALADPRAAQEKDCIIM